MKGFASIICCSLLLVSMTVLVGCSDSGDGNGGGGGASIDETKTVEQVKAEAEKMDDAGLKAAAEKYKNAILAKRTEIDKIMAQLKDIPVTEMLGDKAKDLKANVESLNATVTALKGHYDVFISALKEKGVDVSSLSL